MLSHVARCVRHVRPRDGTAVRARELVRSGALVNWMAEQGCELRFEVGLTYNSAKTTEPHILLQYNCKAVFYRFQ